MFKLENLDRDLYLPFHKDGYNIVHTYRSFLSPTEYSLQWSWRNYVYYQCDNILCKYNWPIDKSDALVDKDRFIILLECPACQSNLVTAKWTYYPSPPMKQLNGNNYFLHDVIEDKTNLIGNLYDLKKLNSESYSGIYHIHKQFEAVI